MSVTRKSSALLWSVQGLLALVFLFAGGMKLVLPPEMLKGPIALSGLFLRFIGVCETLGAVGLILPGALRIHRALTPVAAVGLVTIMVGATVITAAGMGFAPALIPLVVGLLAASVAYGRREWLRLEVSIPRVVIRRVSRA
jgi:DoxX-like family